MQKATTFAVFVVLFFAAGAANAQQTDFSWNLPTSDVFEDPYTGGIHSGARDVAGPYDLDGDGLYEVLVSDYTGGGRVHVFENVSADTWELVFSTPVLDSTASTNNIRAITGGDLDGDGLGEIMFLAGRSYSATNPDIANLPPGLYVFENTGSDDDYGTAPAAVYDFPDDVPDRWRAEQMTTIDVDGDGQQELLFGNNGSANNSDNWFVISVTGDIGSGFETWVQELRLSSRKSEAYDPVDRGGGSPYGMVAADFDGDGMMEISMQSWNYYNFTNAQATGADTYLAPDSNATDVFLQSAFPSDDVAFFGCVAVDIDGNGDDEVFCPNLQTGDVSIVNYEDGEDVLKVLPENVVVGLIPGLSSLGVAAGDLDNDGKMEIFGSGPSFTSGQFDAGSAPTWIRVAEFDGGDPEDPANYSVVSVPFADDMTDSFDLVVRDSAGTITEYREDGTQGPEFTSKLAFLGDVDGDGFNEIALAFQGVDDSTYVYDEVFNAADSTYSQTLRESNANPNRVFLRIVAGNDFAVNVAEKIIVPSDYVLSVSYPNPFSESTSFSFTLPRDRQVSVKVYDITGRVVRTIVADELYTKGTHDVSWDGRNASGAQVASGTYLYTLEWGNFRQSRSMVRVK